MCGIVVGLTFGKKSKKEEETRQKALRVLTTELLLETEARGKDAVGAAILFNDGNYYGIKRGEQVGSFLHKFAKTKEYYGGFLKVWEKHAAPVRVYLGHCRAATHGDKSNNVNNHPIKIGNIIGIHNGTLRNHEEIFKKLGCKRDGEVDSEAIFRLFDHFTKKGTEPFTMEMIQEIVNRLEGQFAVTLFNADNLKQVPVFRDARPVELILLRNLGILLMVSEIKFWKAVWPAYERMVNYHHNDLPSLLGEDNIETKTMPDDSAFIFDLDTEVTKETKIDDLGEWKKMDRLHKIWRSNSTTSTYGTYGRCGYVGYNYSGNKKTDKKETVTKDKKPSTTAVTTDDKKGKRRVFDNILKRYVVKIGDKVLDEKTGAIIDIDTEENYGYELDMEEEIHGAKAIIEDKTKYVNKRDDNKEIIDADGVETITINTNTIPVEVKETAELAYRELPENEKGFASDEELLDKLEIANENVLKQLGPTVIANRTFRYAWKLGFMAAMMEDLDYKWIEKSEKRTQYIEKLKTLILTITKSKSETNEIDKTIEQIRAVFKDEELESIKKYVEVEK